MGNNMYDTQKEHRSTRKQSGDMRSIVQIRLHTIYFGFYERNEIKTG